jgi:hypothetical protein
MHSGADLRERRRYYENRLQKNNPALYVIVAP